MNKKDWVAMCLAYRLPRAVIRWAVIRATAHATMGQWSDVPVSEVTAFEVLERWDIQ